MAEQETNVPVTQTPPAVTEPAPVPVVVEATVTAPVVETAPVSVPDATLAPAPVVETVESVKSETVLGEALTEAPKVEETKPVTPEPQATQAQETEGQSVEPAPPPTYDTFTVPEGVTLDTERVTKFTELLAGLELEGKADHVSVQQFGQKAIDFHVQEVQKAVDSVAELYKTTWERQKTDWKDSFLKDPEIGGNRFQTTVDAARNFIRTHGGTPEQQAEFRSVMETSGLGNHPAIIRLLSRAGAAMEEGKPLAAQKPAAPPKSKTATLYGGGKN